MKKKKDSGELFTELTADMQKEILGNPVYSKSKNLLKFRFKRDVRGKLYIVNFFQI